MTREELEHAIRAACDVANDDAIYVFGSQAILGQFPEAPEELRMSAEIDVSPRSYPERVDRIDGALGELSAFHDAFGFYVHGVPIETAILPAEWEQRVIVVQNANTRHSAGLRRTESSSDDSNRRELKTLPKAALGSIRLRVSARRAYEVAISEVSHPPMTRTSAPCGMTARIRPFVSAMRNIDVTAASAAGEIDVVELGVVQREPAWSARCLGSCGHRGGLRRWCPTTSRCHEHSARAHCQTRIPSS